MIRLSKGTATSAATGSTAANNSNLENAMPNLKIVNGNTNVTNPQPPPVSNALLVAQPQIKIKRSSVKFNERQVSAS